MSTTEIYGFGEDGKAEFIGETRNAWRGAMAVWTLLEKKYLGLLPSVFEDHEGLSRTTCISNLEQSVQEIWDLVEDKRLREVERIVLKSTFDYHIVRAENLPKLIISYRTFDTTVGGETSLSEQADILERYRHDYIAFGFNQTSVNCAFWTENLAACDCEDCDQCTEERYSILDGDKHFYIFDD